MKVWVAQGFGVGAIPFAPGTFGSVLGLLWLAALLATGSGVVLLAGTAVGFFLSVWLCGEAEAILGRKDPGCVVLDEITAMPLCFFSWALLFWRDLHRFPGLKDLSWVTAIGVFVAFRIFDILKPWPVRQSQRLPGGWGVTVDDFLAASYVCLGVVVLYVVRPAFVIPQARS